MPIVRRARIHRTCLLFVFVSLLSGSCSLSGDRRVDKLVGNDTTVYGDTLPDCARCAIRLVPLVTMGSLSDSVVLEDMPSLEHDSKGRFYALTTQILMYDERGRLSRVIGRRGNGPAEFRNIADIRVGAGDSLFVLHDRQLTVFDSAGRVGRNVTFEIPWSISNAQLAGVVPEGVIVAQYPDRRVRDTTTTLLNLYGNDGKHVRSFAPIGLMGEYQRELKTGCCKRHSAMTSDGFIWLGDIGHRFERSDLHGRVDRVIGVRTPPHWDQPLVMSLQELKAELGPPSEAKRLAAPPARAPGVHTSPLPARPRTHRTSIGLLEDTLLVVLMREAAANWQELVDTINVGPDGKHATYRVDSFDRMFDTVIDVIDTKSGALLARHLFGGLLMFTSDGTLYRRSVSGTGLIRVEAFALRFSTK